MKKLIVESGSTKTDWILLTGDKMSFHKTTPGLNASYMNLDKLVQNIHDYDLGLLDEKGMDIYYYGAGCSGETRTRKMKSALSKSFLNAHEIYVFNDIVAAAHAALGNEKGLIAILGTGANIGYFNGKDVEQQYTSGGYLLSDEGSGNHMGKMLLRSILFKRIPENLLAKFNDEYSLSPDDFIVELYQSESPNQYLASFVPFLKKHEKVPFITEMIMGCLRDFFDLHVLKYKNEHDLPLSFVGSVAFHFQSLISEIAVEKGVEMGKIVSAPLDRLLDYHRSN